MKIIVNGACGRMGKALRAIMNERAVETAAAVDPFAGEEGILSSLADFSGEADCIIDFSNHTGAPTLAEFAAKSKLPLVVATTGHTEEELAAIREAAKSVPVFYSGNMSLGIAVLTELVKTAVKMFPDADIEIVESHHNQKLDVPSGTALMLANAIKTVRETAKYVFGRHGQSKRERDEIGIHAIRMGNIVGEHEIIIGTDNETITIKHEAHDRALFAEGALAAADFISGKPAGAYDMQSMLK